MSPSCPAIVPLPTKLEVTGGSYELTAETTIACDPGAADCAHLLRDYLDVTGLPLVLRTGPGTGGITLRLTPGEHGLGEEGYQLSATVDGVHISAPSTHGLRHGIQTMRQLLPAQVFGTAPQPGLAWRVPCVEISDSPRFGWRGSLLDVGRWYLPMDYLYRYVETLAVHKLNRFHLHLTEDQGWRFEVQRYPRLTAVGAWRRESQRGPRQDPRTTALRTAASTRSRSDRLRRLVAPLLRAARSGERAQRHRRRVARRSRGRARAPAGRRCAFGGQTPLNLAAPLAAGGVSLLGSDLEAIDQAEERVRFSALLDRLGIPQPEGGMAHSIEEALTLADRIGYPVIVRPSFVIGGLAIDFCY